MYKVIGWRAALLICLAAVAAFASVYLGIDASVGAMAALPQDAVSLPILMYHRVQKDPAKQGKYVVSPQVFESDLIFLKEQGYTSISAEQLIAYVHSGAELPEKPIMLTLDDGYLDNLIYVVPLLEKHDMCAIISVVGSYTDVYSSASDHNPAYAYLSYYDICEAAASGYIEIGNHTYDMHRNDSRRGATRKTGESKEDYQAALHEDIKRLQDNIFEQCGFLPAVFTYPFGRVDKASHEVIKALGFKMSLGCGEKVNIITKNPDCLYNLGRFNRPAGISTDRFMKRIG